MAVLTPQQRNALEKAVIDAREKAELGLSMLCMAWLWIVLNHLHT